MGLMVDSLQMMFLPSSNLNRFSHFCRAHKRDQQTDGQTARQTDNDTLVCSNRPLSLNVKQPNNNANDKMHTDTGNIIKVLKCAGPGWKARKPSSALQT